MSVILNLIWVIFGGFMIAVEYVLSGVAMMLTIVGIPFGLQCFKLARIALWPFGSEIDSTGFPSGCLAGIMNIIWWFLGGFGIALTHLFWGLLFCITIVGIPFGKEHFKLMHVALFPFGKSIS